jgi:hypothetical protein
MTGGTICFSDKFLPSPSLSTTHYAIKLKSCSTVILTELVVSNYEEEMHHNLRKIIISVSKLRDPPSVRKDFQREMCREQNRIVSPMQSN